jgi:hypothetical protein
VPEPADTAAEPTSDGRIREIPSRWWGFQSLRPAQADSIQAAPLIHESLSVIPTGGGRSPSGRRPPLVGMRRFATEQAHRLRQRSHDA